MASPSNRYFPLHIREILSTDDCAASVSYGFQYLIRVVVRPPSGTVDHIPSFEYEQPIEMTTDSYDSEERDILLFGSVPSPALNYLTESYMAGSLERVSTIGSARSAYMGVVR